MFDDFKTEAEKVAEAERQMPLDQVKSYRLAATVLVLNALLAGLFAALVPGIPPPVLEIIIALLLARAVYRLKSSWASVVLVLSVIGAGLQTVLLFSRESFLEGFFGSLAAWGYAGSLALLLTGEPSPRRRAIAIAVFVIVVGGVYALGLAGRAMSS